MGVSAREQYVSIHNDNIVDDDEKNARLFQFQIKSHNF